MLYFLTDLASLLLIFTILGMSFNLLLGYAGLFSVATAAFFGIGAYTTAIAQGTYGLSFVVGIVLAIVACSIASLILGIASLRSSGFYLALGSMAFVFITLSVLEILPITGGHSGYAGIPAPEILGITFDSVGKFLVLMAVITALVGWLIRRVVHSPLGLTMGAIRDDETAARSIGKRPVVVKLVIFALSSAIAGIAGGLYSGLLRFVSPESFTLDTSMEVLAIIVVGGLGSFFGPWIGALIVILVPQALTFLAIPPSWSGPINEVIYSLLIILVIIFRPQGILGGMSSATPWKPLRRRVWTPQLHHQSRAVKDLSTSFGNETREPSDRRLVVKDLSVSFGGNKAVDSVSFELKPGEITALVGPNGAGKTTVFNLITGYVKPDSGTVLLGDQDLTDATPEHRAKLGLVRSFQSIKLFEQLTVLDNVRVAVAEPPAERLIAQFGPQKTIREEIDAAALHVIEQFGLADKTSVRAGVLSFADQKMLMLARLFATGAEFVLLDEPMSGLDAAARERVCAALKTMADRGTAICLVEHSLEVVKSVCTWVEFLAEGRLIAEGPTEEVVSRRELQELYFGV